MAHNGIEETHSRIVNGGLDNGLEHADALNSDPERIKFA